MSNGLNNLYAFDEFSINLRERNLWREEEIVPLPPKVFDTLAVLVERAGETVTKDELLSAVWPDSFVEESNLSQNIYLLRQVFGKERNYIKTIPRKGYKFAAELRQVGEQEERIGMQKAEPAGLPQYPLPRRRGYAAAAALVLLASAAIFGVNYFSPAAAEDSPPIPFTADKVRLDKLTDSGTAYFPSISPDGSFVAYVDTAPAAGGLRLMDTGSGRDVHVPIEGGTVPGITEFAPDGKRIYFKPIGLLRTGLPVYEISYFGGSPGLVAENVWGKFGISQDGTRMAMFRVDVSSNREFLTLKNLVDGTEETAYTAYVPEHLFLYVAPSFSPDGDRVAFLKRPAGDGRSAISLLDRTTGEVTELKTTLDKIFNIAWHPDGMGLFAISKEGDKGRQIFYVSYPNGEITRVTNDLNSYDGISIPRDGKSIVTQQRDFSSNVWTFPNGALSEGKPITTGRYGHFGVVDLEFATEERVIFGGRASVEVGLIAARISDGARTQLTESAGTVNTAISAQADGRFFFITSNRSGVPAIWRVTQDGRHAEQVTTPSDESHWFPALSHDEKALYYVARTSDGSEIRMLGLEDGESSVIFSSPEGAPTRFLEASPDGRYLAFVYETEGEEPEGDENRNIPVRIGILDLSSRTMRSVTIRTSRPRIKWTNGGKTFDFLRGSAIYRQITEEPDAEPVKIFELPGERIFNFDWSFAGTDLVVARGGQVSDLVRIAINR